MNVKVAAPYTRAQIRKVTPRPTVKMPRIELEVILMVDAAIEAREAVHYHPTVQMEAVRVPA